jgi:predicted nucleotidyltransferase
MESKINREQLAKLCRKYNIQLLILHGSHALGHAGNKSDIDIGILCQKKPGMDRKLDLLTDFGGIFGEKFDPVFLNGAEPLISYQVALHGKPLFEKEEGIFQQFKIQAISRYMDSKKFRILEKTYLKRALGKL